MLEWASSHTCLALQTQELGIPIKSTTTTLHNPLHYPFEKKWPSPPSSSETLTCSALRYRNRQPSPRPGAVPFSPPHRDSPSTCPVSLPLHPERSLCHCTFCTRRSFERSRCAKPGPGLGRHRSAAAAAGQASGPASGQTSG